MRQAPALLIYYFVDAGPILGPALSQKLMPKLSKKKKLSSLIYVVYIFICLILKVN
jgi:hypothetical protein